MEQYAVSRVTVRQALTLLRRQGRVVAQRGRGTFVTAATVRHDLDALHGFYHVLRSQGLDPETQLIEFAPDAGTPGEALPAGTDLPVRLKRLYALEGRPFAFVVAHLPRVAAALHAEAAERLMVYDILQQLGLRVAHAEVTIRCQRLPREIGRHLRLRPAELALVMERHSYDDGDALCEWTRIHILPERYEFRLRVPGPLDLARSLHRVEPAAPAAPSGD